MIKPNIGSECKAVGNAILTCPKCGKKDQAPIFKALTTVNISSLKLHELKAAYFAVCKSCGCTFEATEWK